MKLTKIFSFALVIMLLFSACSAGSGNTTEATEDQFKDAVFNEDPKEDDTVNILMTAASFSHYYTDELYGLFAAAGIKARVCNLMKSSTGIAAFYEYWKNGERAFSLIIHDENGRQEIGSVALEDAIQYYNWDVISLQEGSFRFRKLNPEEVLSSNRQAHTELIGFFRQKLPLAQVYTQQIWSYEIGFDRDGYQVNTVEEQMAFEGRVKEYTDAFCEEFDLNVIPSGEAWKIARKSEIVGNLCRRLSVNLGEGDYYHDGDIGGGQYLNACVWFEMLTGQSCVGNTFRPEYELSEEVIAVLQNAAHEAVANLQNVQ